MFDIQSVREEPDRLRIDSLLHSQKKNRFEELPHSAQN
jgi:hypothetical protein